MSDFDVGALYGSLVLLSKLSSDNGLQQNPAKCRSIIFSRVKMFNRYIIDGVVLEIIKERSDLGVMLDCEIRFAERIDKILPQRCSFIRKSC